MARLRTGPGAIDDRSTSSSTIVRLYNFDRDWHELKPEHVTWLDRIAIPRLRSGHRNKIWVIGLASRLGAFSHNLELSKRRAEAVTKYLSNKGAVAITSTYSGEVMARSPKEDDPSDRGAILVIAHKYLPIPIPIILPPKPIPVILPPIPKPTKSTRFKIRIRALTSISIASLVFYKGDFEIEDLVNNLDFQ